MTPPISTGRKGLYPQGLFLFVFVVAIGFAAFLLATQPGGEVEGRQSVDQHGRPKVSLDRSFTPSSVNEGEYVRVKVKLDRALIAKDPMDPAKPHDEADQDVEKYPQGKPICHHGSGIEDDKVLCIEGGIIVWDSYNNWTNDDFADELVAFVFQESFEDKNTNTTENERLERILTYFVCDDGRADGSRYIRIAINTAFEDASHPQRPPPDTYGYDTDHYEVTVRVNDSGKLVPTCTDAKVVIVSEKKLTLEEGEMAKTYTLKLHSPPTHGVAITIKASGDVKVSSDGSTFASEITLTINDKKEHTIHVKADTDADTIKEMETIRHTTSSSDPGYDDIDVANVDVTVNDTGTPPGVTISTLSLRLNPGNTRSYTVKLDKRPTGNSIVIIEITPQAGVTTDKMSLTFTTTDDNWNESQTVTVTAGQTAGEFAITHEIGDGSASEYSAVTVDSIDVTVVAVAPPPPVVVNPPDPATSTPTPTVTMTPTSTRTATPTSVPTSRPRPTRSNSGGGGGGGRGGGGGGGGFRPPPIVQPPPPPPPPP